jgi:glycyl-tRNA synthetase
MDEAGTPFCITIDHDTLEDNTVTIRDRDTTEQERKKIEDAVQYIKDKTSQ